MQIYFLVIHIWFGLSIIVVRIELIINRNWYLSKLIITMITFFLHKCITKYYYNWYKFIQGDVTFIILCFLSVTSVVHVCRQCGGSRVMAYHDPLATLCLSQPSSSQLFPGYGVKKVYLHHDELSYYSCNSVGKKQKPARNKSAVISDFENQRFIKVIFSIH